MYFTVSNGLCHMHTIENTVAEVTTSEQKVILVSKNKPVLITTTTLIILVTWQNQTQIKASHQLRSSSVKTRKTGKEIFQIFAKREILPSPQHYKFPQNLLHISGLVSCRAISRTFIMFSLLRSSS